MRAVFEGCNDLATYGSYMFLLLCSPRSLKGISTASRFPGGWGMMEYLGVPPDSA